MKVIQHLLKQPFLTAVSIAAISHSTWSFAVMFTGIEPHPQFDWSWWAWVLPGAIMAFSIDIGLLSLAYQIRSGQRNPSKLAAFAVLSGAMFYAQFVYISSHMPALALAAGVRAEWSGLVQLVRDCSIWIFPALLPVALILYAFSDKESADSSSAAAPTSLLDKVDETRAEVIVNFIRPEPHPDSALPSVETPALPEPEPIKTDLVEMPALEITETHAVIIPKREYKIRTAQHHCAYCGVAFTPKRADQIYHSASCRTLAYAKRKSEQT